MLKKSVNFQRNEHTFATENHLCYSVDISKKPLTLMVRKTKEGPLSLIFCL